MTYEGPSGSGGKDDALRAWTRSMDDRHFGGAGGGGDEEEVGDAPPVAVAQEEEADPSSGKQEMPLVECPLCFEDLPEGDLFVKPCCGERICQECVDDIPIHVDLHQGTCKLCGAHLDLEAHAGLFSQEEALLIRKGVARATEGGWIPCGATRGCPGGAAGAVGEEAVTCEVCRKSFCASCCERLGGQHHHDGQTCEEYRRAEQGGVEIDDATALAWAGAVQCPNCGTAMQHVGGCDNLTCGKCKKQFHASGSSEAGKHTEDARAFQDALRTLSARSSIKEFRRFLKQFPEQARQFRLDQAVQMLVAAQARGDASAVEQVLAKMSMNPLFGGMVEALRAMFRPLEPALVVLHEALEGAADLPAVLALLRDPANAQAYADIASDAEAVEGIEGCSVAFQMQGFLNRIKDKQVKRKVKTLAGL